MKLTSSTLKQYIKQVLAEQNDEDKKNIYPMIGKPGIDREKQRIEINAACFGWKRKPTVGYEKNPKTGQGRIRDRSRMGKANRVGGKAYRDAKKTGECPTGKISFDQWKKARRLNWQRKLHAANKVLEQSAVTQRGAEKRIAGLAPGEAGAAAGPMTPGELSTSQQAKELEAAMAQGMRDVWMVRERAGLCKRAAPKFECAGPALEAIVKLKATAQNLHDEMKGAGSGDAVKIMIANQNNLAGLWAAYELVTTPWEKKKWGDLAQWLSDEVGCELCKTMWAPRVRAAIAGGGAHRDHGPGTLHHAFDKGEKVASAETTREPKPIEHKRGPLAKKLGVYPESKAFSSFPGQQKLTEGWKKYLDTE